MKYTFFSDDFGAFVFGREIFKKNPTISLEFLVKKGSEEKPKDSLCEQDFWNTAMRNLIEKTRFGRIGIFFDRENFEAKEFFVSSNLEKMKKTYSPKNYRSEKDLQILIFETQVLKQMANENWADSVEFRRIARKFIRQAKHSNIDTILFADAILGSEITKKILQHLVGARIKCVFLSDCLGDEFFQKREEKGSVKIVTGDDVEFTREVAEKVLRRKIGNTAIHHF